MSNANLFKSKERYPYHYEYGLVGSYSTKEGYEYGIKYKDELVEEYKRNLEIKVERAIMGGNYKIHNNEKGESA